MSAVEQPWVPKASGDPSSRTLAQNMKPFAILILLLGFMPLLRADQAFVVENLGVLVTMPNGWTHDESDKFGFVLHPLR